MASSALPATAPTNMRVGVFFCFVFCAPAYIICQESPYLSASHVYLLLKGYSPSSIRIEPPSTNFFDKVSTSSAVSQETRNDIAGVNLKIGPPFKAANFWPASSNSTVITEPTGLPDTFAAFSSYRAVAPILGFLNREV